MNLKLTEFVMKFTILLTFILAVLFNFDSFGQSNSQKSIKGTVLDSATSKPVAFATLSFKKSGDASIRRILTKESGTFEISNLSYGEYIATITQIGYMSKMINIKLLDSTKSEVDLGEISIKQQIQQLNSVTITAERPIVKQEIDRISYDVQADPESKSINLLEMMRKVPFLALDAEENIQLKGSGSFRVLLNGRTSPMLVRNVREIFKSMSASNIKSIEVITDPPAKYDGEGLAGIINIITLKRTENGYNASLNLRESFPGNGPGISGNLNSKFGKLGITALASGNLNNTRPIYSNSIRNTTSKLIQNGLRSSDTRTLLGGIELSYELDTLNLIAIQLNSNTIRLEDENVQNSLLTDNSGILQRYTLSSINKTPANTSEVAIHYQLGFRSNKNRLLTFSYRYSDITTDQITNVALSDKINYIDPNYIQSNTSGARDQTFQIDYVHPLKKINIEAGIKGIIRENEADFKFNEVNISGQFINDPLRSNQFQNTQNILSIYNSYQYSIKNWGLRVGARLENTDFDADFGFASTVISRNYLNILPSVLVTKKLNNSSSMNFGFTQRIERPAITYLNPFVDRQNPNYESSGNPNLRPALTNNLSVSYSNFKKASLSLNLSYAFVNNMIQRVTTFDPSTNISSNNYDNVGKNRSLMAFTYINFPITKKINVISTGILSYIWLSGLVNNVQTSNDGLRGTLFSSVGYRFDSGMRINGSINYNSAGVLLQGSSRGIITSSFSGNTDLVKNKLTLSASVTNPFTRFRTNHFETSSLNFTQVNDMQYYFRVFNASLNYRFGTLKSSVKKNKRGITVDDNVSKQEP